MIVAILALVVVTLAALLVSIRAGYNGRLFKVAAWVFFGGLFAEDALIVAYAMFRVGA